MYNSIGGTPATPLDMLMGIFGGATAKGAPGSEEFGRMLGLFDAVTGESNGLPVPGLPMTPDPDVAVVDIPQLLLPQDLAQTLGFNGQPLPELKGRELPTDNPQSMISARGELLSIDKGDNQALYLKLLPGGMGIDADSQLAGSEDNVEEMVLPMRLRTVEQQGGRIIADAELQTATGKDASIRIRLELAGNPARIQEMISQPAKAVTTPGQSPQKSELSLPHLLNSLDVKSLVIEQIPDAPNAVSKEILPGMTTMARNISGLKMSSNSPTALNSAAIGNQSESEFTRVAPMMPGNDDNQSSGMSGKQNKMDWLLFENASGNNQTAGNSSALAGESALSGITTIAASEVGNAAAVTDGNSDLTQVRFYNLDNKLDQLKQNPGQKINIQLMPSRLGKMELSIISHRGTITVKLAVDSIQAKQAVEKNLAQLEGRLSSTGIKVDNFQLQVNQSSRSASHSAYQQQYDHSQDGFTGHRDRGFHQQADDRRRMEQFRLSDTGFEQAMINCLA